MSNFEHDELVSTVANKYEEKGYQVTLEPEDGAALYPDFLAGMKYRPDLIAVKEDDKVIVEVKNRKSLIHNSAMQKISESVDAVPDWRLELHVYNDSDLNKIDTEKDKNIDKEEILSKIEKIKTLVSMKYFEPAFLMSWAALEAAARTKLERENEKNIYKNPNLLFKQLYTKEYLNYNHFNFIKKYEPFRNKIAHGLDTDNQLDETVFEKIIRVIKLLLEADHSAKYIHWMDEIDLLDLDDAFLLYSSLKNKNENTNFLTQSKNGAIRVKDKQSDKVFEFPKEELHQIISVTEDEFIESDQQSKQWNELKRKYAN